MHKLDPKVRKSIELALRGGNKMHAIRLYMDAVPGSTFAEAKSEVESILTGLYITETASQGQHYDEERSDNPLTSSRSIMTGISYVDRLQIAEALFDGRKIEAIKIFREVSGCKDIAKAKKIVEIYAEELYRAFPKNFRRPPKRLEIHINPLLAALIISIFILLVICVVYLIILSK